MSGIIINPYAFAAEAFSTKSLDFDGVDDTTITYPINITFKPLPAVPLPI